MKTASFYQQFQLDLTLVKEASFNPYYPVINSGLNESLQIDGSAFIDLASNNYLGLANDPGVKQAGIEAIEKYGASLCATPIASGYSELHRDLENKLSDFVGLEGTLIYPSCYQANNGLFPAIAGKKDIAVVDRNAHSSLIEGIKASGCKIWPFIHNDMDHLEKVLKKVKQYQQIFVVTESVFSTEGTIAPFAEIVKLCERYDAIPVIDDSHGIGVLGKQGKGILEYAGIDDYQGIYTASLGKAVANAGGMISGKESLMNYLRYYSSHLVYSTAILPSVLAGISKVIDIINSDFAEISKRLWDNTKYLTTTLESAGYNLCNSVTPIVSVKSGSSLETIKTTKTFYENKILTTPFIYPSVPRNEGRIRLIAGANLSSAIMEKVNELISKKLILTA